MSKILSALILAAAVFSAPASAAGRDDPDTQMAKLLDGRVAGPPVNCIQLSTVTSSTIVEGRAIVYRSGSKLYVNQPRSGAETLDDDDVLVTRSFGSQLCSSDPVDLVSRASRFTRGFVLLGDFVPYTKVRSARR
jgi:hypothetical protein